MKHDDVNRMFLLAKRDISEWGSRYEPKSNQLDVVLIKFVGNRHVDKRPESSCFIVVRGIGAYEPQFIL